MFRRGYIDQKYFSRLFVIKFEKYDIQLGYIVVFFMTRVKSMIVGKNMDAGKLRYLHGQKELDTNLGIQQYLLFKISRLVVFSSAHYKYKIFFEEFKERNGVGFVDIRVHLPPTVI